MMLVALLLWHLFSTSRRGGDVVATTDSLTSAQLGSVDGRNSSVDASPSAPRAQAAVDGLTFAGLDGGDDGGADPTTLAQTNDARLDEWLRKNAREADEHLETFCTESLALQDAGILSSRRGSRDAAAYLGVRVDWQDGSLGLLHPPQPLVARLDALPDDTWVALPEDAWAGLDFSWLSQLLAFDTWSLSGDGSLRNSDQVGLTDDTLPDFASLALWSKLHLARGLRHGHLASASSEVRHLASLLISTGTWWGGLGAEELVRLDLVAWEASQLPVPEGVVSRDERQRFRRVANTAPLFFLPGVSAHTRDRALGCASPVRCASLAESLWLQSATRELLHDEMAWLMAQPGCDRGLFERIQRAPPLSRDEAAKVFGDNFGIALGLFPPPF